MATSETKTLIGSFSVVLGARTYNPGRLLVYTATVEAIPARPHARPELSLGPSFRFSIKCVGQEQTLGHCETLGDAIRMARDSLESVYDCYVHNIRGEADDRLFGINWETLSPSAVESLTERYQAVLVKLQGRRDSGFVTGELLRIEGSIRRALEA